MIIEFIRHLPPFLNKRISERLPQLSGRTAALLYMYYKKSVVLVLILSGEVSKQLASSIVTIDNPA